MRREKIACIGAGNVGGQIAARLAVREDGDIVIIETPEREGVARGKAADIMHRSSLTESDVLVTGSSDYSAIIDASVCILSAGLPRTSDISRDDLFEANIRIAVAAGSAIREYAPNSFVIVITNPLDSITYAVWKTTGFAREKVVGMAGMLDSARCRSHISMAVGCSVKDVNALVLGSHGDLMVPVAGHCNVNGVPITELLTTSELDEIMASTRHGGGDLVKLMGTSAYFAAAEAACQMAGSFLKDEKRVMPCSVFLTGQYGIDGLFFGVPAIVGGNGVEQILEIRLSEEEQRQLSKSADYLKEKCSKVDEICSATILESSPTVESSSIRRMRQQSVQ